MVELSDSFDCYGLPSLVDSLVGVDKLGRGCRVGNGFFIRRGDPRPNRGVFFGDDVLLFHDIYFVVGDLDSYPEAGITLGDRVVMNLGCYVSGEGGLIIEDDVLIGPHVKILSAGHQIHGGDAVIARNPLTYGKIRIGRGAWVGAGVTVLEGVQIGEGAVVGAGSVVTRDVPRFMIAVGNPARVIKSRVGHRQHGFLRRWLKC